MTIDKSSFTGRLGLDKGGNDEIKDDMDRCKEHMSSLLQSDAVMTEELAQKIAPNCPKSHLVTYYTMHCNMMAVRWIIMYIVNMQLVVHNCIILLH